MEDIAVHDRGTQSAASYPIDKPPGVIAAESARLAQFVPERNVIDILVDQHVKVAEQGVLDDAAHRTAPLGECLHELMIGGVTLGHDPYSIAGKMRAPPLWEVRNVTGEGRLVI